MALIKPTRQGQPKAPPGKRLLLVDPYPRNSQYHLTASERRAVWFPKLSLPTIAAYTPDSWDVDLVDEAVQDIDFDTPCDMVGLSIKCIVFAKHTEWFSMIEDWLYPFQPVKNRKWLMRYGITCRYPNRRMERAIGLTDSHKRSSG
jgi:hypothetical protein